MRAHAHGELQAWLDGTLYPALFRNLPSAFPEFGWRRFSRGWQATRWPANFPEAVDHPNPERLQVYADGPAYIKIHGRGAVRFLHIAAGESSPRGERFVQAIRDLAGRAGVDASFLERELTPEEQAQANARELRRAALSVIIEACQDRLHSEAGLVAREYLAGRGLSEEDMMHFQLGLYDLAELQVLLSRGGFSSETRNEVLRRNFDGYITFPWADAFGYPLTLYGRWPGSPPEGRPKTMALPGEGTKGAPLYLDRALRGGHREVVAVEGIMDALLLQARGETRAVAYVAAQFSTTQIETLVRHRVERVILCGDPDGGGDKGTLNNVEHLEAAGISTLVMERLPDGLDPDELLLRDGIDAWRDRVLGATPGRVWQAERVIGELSPTSPESLRRKALDGLKAIYRHEGREAALDRERILALASKRLGYPRSLVRKMLAGDEPKDAASAPAPEVLQPQEGWRRELIRDHAGQIVPSLANTALILRNAPGIAGAIAYNELRRDVELRTAPPWRSEGGTWTDVDDAQAAIWLHQTHRLHVRSDTVREASLVVAREQSYDPLKIYLQGIRWDGTPRIETWLTAYLGVQDTPLARGIGAAWLRSAVGRALVPGLEVHAALILEGLQGRGKSSAFRILAGEFFCDETLDLHSKDAILIVSRSWIVEMAELSSLTRSEVEQTKSFLSRMVDRFRPPFGRRVIEVPRRCVFGGSTNASDYLVDATGNRRFWPVRVGSIDLDALARDRDQLWAEAVASFLDGATHNLAPQLWGAATEAAEARYQADAWEERIAPYLKAHESAPLGVSQGEILEEAIGLPRERWGQVEQRRVAKILQRLGWEKFRAPPDAGGYRPWRYRYPGRYSDGV
jgi:predicted P-loop ATPase